MGEQFMTLMLLPGQAPSDVTQDELGRYRVPRNWLGRIFLPGKTKPAITTEDVGEAAEDFVFLSREQITETLGNVSMPLVRQDGTTTTITLNEMLAYAISDTEETIRRQAETGKELYNPRQAFQEIWYQQLAGFTSGIQPGEWTEVDAIGYQSLRPPEYGPPALSPAYQGAVVPDPGVTPGGPFGIGAGRPKDQTHPIGRAFEFMRDAPGQPNVMRAQPLETAQGIAAARAIGAPSEFLGAINNLIQAGEFDEAQSLAAAIMPTDPSILDELQQSGMIYDYFLEYVDNADGTQLMVRFNPTSVPYPVIE